MPSRRRPRPPHSSHLAVHGFEVHAGLHAAASVLDRHTHRMPTICSVQYGRFTEYYAGSAFDCDERTLKITPAEELHWNRFAEVDTFGLRIDVDSGAFGDVTPVSRLLERRAFFAADEYALLSRQLLREMSEPDAVTALSVEGLLLELLARMARLHRARTEVPAFVRRARELVNDLFRTHLTLDDVAAASGATPAQLARAYRVHYGCTIAQHVRRLRIEAAEHELVTTDAKLVEIALRAGFYDQSHFANAYRRHYGLTPAQRRRQLS
jgi:AraC family transcriptional regulator